MSADKDARIAELQAERDRYRATAYELAADAGALLDRVNELQAENARLTTERDEWQRCQSYRYIGRDGKAVLARDLEDRAEAAEADNARLRDALIALVTALDESGPFGGEVYLDRMERMWNAAWKSARAALEAKP